MNNIFLPSNDPLLYNTQYYQRDLQQKMDNKYNEYLIRTQQIPDMLGDLDKKLKSLSPSVATELENDTEFMDLSNELKESINAEMVLLVKNQINSNSAYTKNIEKQLSIIKRVEAKASETEKRNMAELNEYLTHYSNITFDEYKKLKASANEN
jgi:hypothetical protein